MLFTVQTFSHIHCAFAVVAAVEDHFSHQLARALFVQPALSIAAIERRNHRLLELNMDLVATVQFQGNLSFCGCHAPCISTANSRSSIGALYYHSAVADPGLGSILVYRPVCCSRSIRAQVLVYPAEFQALPGYNRTHCCAAICVHRLSLAEAKRCHV